MPAIIRNRIIIPGLASSSEGVFTIPRVRVHCPSSPPRHPSAIPSQIAMISAAHREECQSHDASRLAGSDQDEEQVFLTVSDATMDQFVGTARCSTREAQAIDTYSYQEAGEDAGNLGGLTAGSVESSLTSSAGTDAVYPAINLSSSRGFISNEGQSLDP